MQISAALQGKRLYLTTKTNFYSKYRNTFNIFFRLIKLQAKCTAKRMLSHSHCQHHYDIKITVQLSMNQKSNQNKHNTRGILK